VNLPVPSYASTHKVPQRRAGTALLFIALLTIVLDTTGLSISPNVCSYLLFGALIIVALAACTTQGGITSLVGLLLLSTVIFNAAQPIYVALTGDSSIYTLTFGTTVEPDGRALFHLLTFWTVGIASAFGGYFLFFIPKIVRRDALDYAPRVFCKRAFIAAFLIVGILLPITLHSRVEAFGSGGYTALYLGQTEYSFGLARLIDFLCPLLYSLSVLINEKRYSRMMLVAVLGYVFTGILVGQRMQAGCWLFVMLWHFSTIRRKSLGIAPLLLGLVLTATLFQVIDTLRGGATTGRFILAQYFVAQGITFLLPALSWTVPSPPVHTVLGALFPTGGLYHLLGIGTTADSNISSYICSQSDPLLFESGNGLGSSCYIEVFYLCGGVMLLYGFAIGLFGFLLRKWEERSASSPVALFFLCISLSSLFSIPRSSPSNITAQIVYDSTFMVLIFLVSRIFNIARSGDTRMEAVHGTH
jgi:O-antigen polysaccharide polymerase Wzy